MGGDRRHGRLWCFSVRIAATSFFPGSEAWLGTKIDLKALEEACPNMVLYIMSGDKAVGFPDGDSYKAYMHKNIPWADVRMGRTRGGNRHYMDLPNAMLDPSEMDTIFAM